MKKSSVNMFEQSFGRQAARITFIGEKMFRFQIAPDGVFRESGLNRYGFIKPPSGPAPKVKRERGRGGLKLETAALRVELAAGGGALRVYDKRRRREIMRQTGAEFSSGSVRVHFKAEPGEDWVGFGDQTRARLYHRGTVADLWVRNVRSYLPVPFFMSTRGAGTLVNTTHHLVCDMCRSRKGEYFWDDPRGAVDYYVFAGADFAEMVDTYTELTGKPKLPPVWAFGLWYLCRSQADAYEAVNDACNFRREQIPCDVFGFEPGWMEKYYDYSTEKKWSRERFPVPSYAWQGPNNFLNALKRMGFKVELWLCNNYDLTWEEERRLRRVSPAFDIHGTGSSSAGHEVDEHLQGRDMLDKVTRPNEPWFEHLKKFVDQGVDFFKQDGALQVLEHPDRLAANGMHDAELHNLYPLLYARQMHEGFAEYAGRRPVVFTVAGWAGFQAWCGTWAGDTGGGLDTIGGMLNLALLGHSWITNDMEVHTPAGIHFGYLQPWSQINSWNYFRMPWVQGQELLAMHRFYARLRARLVPYLYSWAYQATRSAMPLMRPLTFEYPADLKCRRIIHQYLLGRDLMVAAFKPRVYFPTGRWKDYWTGAIIKGGRALKITWPAQRGGGLYMREGGIIPMGPVMQYRGEKPLDEMELYLFPGNKKSVFKFYEDDGVSFDHLRGKYALTEIACLAGGGQVAVSVARPEGALAIARAAAGRRWSFAIALDFEPRRVVANGRQLPDGTWKFDAKRREISIGAQCGPVNLVID